MHAAASLLMIMNVDAMNLLRLPRYSSKQRLKEKLLYAITTAAHGFGLT
jgi:nanoRNase/pAp phosphatase (c-di-AMP/oligoRNAs hydrolase)